MPPGWPPCWSTPRRCSRPSWSCCPAATSIRCCCRSCSGTACGPPGAYLAFRCRLPDRPGALATLLHQLAGLGANVLDVWHERVTPRLQVGEVEVLLQVETRGPEHCEEVITELRQAGYTLVFG